MIVETAFLSILNQMEFNAVQKIERKTVSTIISHSILKGNENLVLSVNSLNGAEGVKKKCYILQKCFFFSKIDLNILAVYFELLVCSLPGHVSKYF